MHSLRQLRASLVTSMKQFIIVGFKNKLWYNCNDTYLGWDKWWPTLRAQEWQWSVRICCGWAAGWVGCWMEGAVEWQGHAHWLGEELTSSSGSTKSSMLSTEPERSSCKSSKSFCKLLAENEPYEKGLQSFFSVITHGNITRLCICTTVGEVVADWSTYGHNVPETQVL